VQRVPPIIDWHNHFGCHNSEQSLGVVCVTTQQTTTAMMRLITSVYFALLLVLWESNVAATGLRHPLIETAVNEENNIEFNETTTTTTTTDQGRDLATANYYHVAKLGGPNPDAAIGNPLKGLVESPIYTNPPYKSEIPLAVEFYYVGTYWYDVFVDYHQGTELSQVDVGTVRLG
jgi:hypothetical protein